MSEMFPYKGASYNDFRDTVILDLCRGKRVLHIGATDAPYTKERFENNSLLHLKLMDVATEVVGVDIDKNSIDYLSENGVKNILNLDMNRLEDIDFSPDIILMGEVIEHLMNLEVALINLKKVCNDKCKILISTPNMFNIVNFYKIFFSNVEPIHPDHKVGFTYGTLENLVVNVGLEVEKFYFTFLSRRKSIRKRLQHFICRFRPGFSETLLAVIKNK